MEPIKFSSLIQSLEKTEPSLSELIERSTLLTVIERYLDHNKYIDRAELAALIGHKLPTEEPKHDPLP